MDTTWLKVSSHTAVTGWWLEWLHIGTHTDFYRLAQPHLTTLSRLDPELPPTYFILLHILFPPTGAVIILAICRTFTMPGITPVAFPSLLHLTQSDEVDVFDLFLLMSQLAIQSHTAGMWRNPEAKLGSSDPAPLLHKLSGWPTPTKITFNISPRAPCSCLFPNSNLPKAHFVLSSISTQVTTTQIHFALIISEMFSVRQESQFLFLFFSPKNLLRCLVCNTWTVKVC